MFSVIIPVYNGARFIEEAINCVFKQTYTDWEIIIINDGSKDETPKILEKYTDNEKILIINQENQGVSVARNNGVLHAKGDYIAFLDADDLWHENHLEVLNELIGKYPSAGLYAPSMLTEFEDGKKIVESEYFNGKDEDILLDDFLLEYSNNKSVKLFTASTTCVSKEAFLKSGGFPRGVKIGEDLELTLVISAFYPIALTSKITATYRKANSVATKDISFDPDWHFFDSVNELYNNPDISYEKKINLKKLMEWFTMRRCRHYIIDGKKRIAWKHFKTIIYNKNLLKDNAITFVLFFIPASAVKQMFRSRWRNKS